MLVLVLLNHFVQHPLKKYTGLKTFSMDWMETQCCLRCNKGGNLLVCSESGCPIAVHKKCLSCEAQFDDFGKFYCPYCIFKRVTEEMRQLRDKAMLARESLLKFIDEEMVDGTNAQKPEPLISEKKEPNSSAVAGNLESDDFGNNGVHLEDQHLEKQPPTCTSAPLPCDGTDELIVDKRNEGALQRSQNSDINECDNSMMMVVYQPRLNPIGALDDGDHVQCEELTNQAEIVHVTKVEPLTEVDDCQYENVNKYHELTQNSSRMHAPVLSTKRTNNHAKVVKEKQNITEVDCMQEQVQKNTESLAPGLHLQSKFNKETDILPKQLRSLKRKNPPESEAQNHIPPSRSKGVSCGESYSKQVRQPLTQHTNLTFVNGKRGKIFWTPEEEDMLKEGVKKFSVTMNKNIPWKKILDFGHHVFDASRTPADLKDKWRNISQRRLNQ